MKRYKKKMNVVSGTMSEKYDGIQGVWDGRILKTRTGNVINAPEWWLHDLPQVPLKGELWTKRNDFSNIQSIVTTQDGSGNWASIRFMVFNDSIFMYNTSDYVYEVRKYICFSQTQVDEVYKEIIRCGGEGIVITINGIDYKRKPKTYDDGQVVGHEAGINVGETGALIVKLRDGRTMKISGMSLDLKRNPPAIGMIIEFSHWGHTSTGKPRFAGFHRVRAETHLNF